jgi:hypothetical protein
MEEAPKMGVTPESPAEKVLELMGKFPKIMKQLADNYQERKKLETIIEMFVGEEGNPIQDRLQLMLDHQKAANDQLRADMESVIVGIEEAGFGNVVAGARENIAKLD